MALLIMIANDLKSLSEKEVPNLTKLNLTKPNLINHKQKDLLEGSWRESFCAQMWVCLCRPLLFLNSGSSAERTLP